MPTYDYRCLKCKKKFEKTQSMKDEPLKRCIYCSGKVERLIGAGSGLIFKGSGFYQTDYKKAKAPTTETKKVERTPPPKADAPAAGKKKE
jgi:putative FmdB family regulatory protein